jgi:hypothetical protein
LAIAPIQPQLFSKMLGTFLLLLGEKERDEGERKKVGMADAE